LLLLSNCLTFCQEFLISDNIEKGYIKDGNKINIWEYYDKEGNTIFKFNHSTGELIYIKQESTKYLLDIDNEWIYTTTNIPPTYIGSENEFYRNIARKLYYPAYALESSIEGYMYISFIVDSTGLPTNIFLEKDLCDSCGIGIVSIIEENLGRWIPAQIDKSCFKSKFLLPIKYVKEENRNKNFKNKNYEGKVLKELVVMSYGNHSNNSGRKITSLTDIFNFNDLETALTYKETVKQLDLSSQNLSVLPDKVTQINSIKTLILKNNKLTSLPKKINRLYKLEHLLLDSNYLDSLPLKFDKLKSLSILTLTSNQFNEFPSEVFKLKNLKVLDLSDNNITTIPAEIGSMKNLEVLAVLNNDITSLPDEIFQLQNLKKLYINENNLDKQSQMKIKNQLKNVEVFNE
jgi:hypothetical protein